MIRAIFFVDEAFKIMDLWNEKTAKAERVFVKEGKKMKGLIKERKRVKNYQIDIFKVSSSKEIEKIIKEFDLDFREVLVVALSNSNFKERFIGSSSGFYHAIDYGFMVVPKKNERKYLNEIVSTFFLNWDKERSGKLSKFQERFI